MNNEAYTSYPAEGEIVLSDNTALFNLSVQRGVTISNTHPSFAKYNGMTFTVIHTFKVGWPLEHPTIDQDSQKFTSH